MRRPCAGSRVWGGTLALTPLVVLVLSWAWGCCGAVDQLVLVGQLGWGRPVLGALPPEGLMCLCPVVRSGEDVFFFFFLSLPLGK